MTPEPTPAQRSTARNLAGVHLLSAVAHLRTVGDPMLCGYALALLRRVGDPVTPDAAPGSEAARQWSVRAAVQRRGLERVVARVEAWRGDREDATSVEDLCRDAYFGGIAAGIDSVMPELADSARQLADYLGTPDRPWRTGPPPKDGSAIVVVGNLVEIHDDGAADVDPFTETVRWGGEAGWLYANESSLAVRETLGMHLVVLHWLPAPA